MLLNDSEFIFLNYYQTEIVFFFIKPAPSNIYRFSGSKQKISSLDTDDPGSNPNGV